MFQKKVQAVDDRPLLIGRHPIVDAINEGITLDKVMMLDSIRGDFEREMRRLCKIHDIPLQIVPKDRLQRLSNANHQGIIGIRAHIAYQQLEDVLPHCYEKGESPLILLLDRITDVRNFGAIARSAELCGVHAIVIPTKDAAPIHGESIKSSAGALTRIPVCRTHSMPNMVQSLKDAGVRVVVASQNAEKYLFEEELSGPLAIIMGSEGEGVAYALEKAADLTVKIPQIGNTESFNVSVAAGIMLYEVTKQRLKADI